jgi:hypothetical protein
MAVSEVLEMETAPEVSTPDGETVERVFQAVVQRLKERFHVPTATYRLQFNKYFTFAHAREQAAYLHKLGISDIYASPYFKAGAESLHVTISPTITS